MKNKGFAMQAIGEYLDNDLASALKYRDYKDATDLIVERVFTAPVYGGYIEVERWGGGTLKASGGDIGGGSEIRQEIDNEHYVRYAVRRLTPVECERLQGYRDDWTHISPIEDISDDDLDFWNEQYRVNAEINGKTYKEKTKEQMIKWYNKLECDGAKYKALGNSLALPCAEVPLAGCARFGAKTMASLFDGIGGFVVVGRLHGIECLWTSEIEAFPIAVTKERFG